MNFTLHLKARDGVMYSLLPFSVPIPEGSIVENANIAFLFETTDDNVFSVDLEVDEVRLDRIASSPKKASWRWNVGFHAGIVTIRLLGASEKPILLKVQTDPTCAKLTREQFTTMVGDIIADSTAIANLAGHRISLERGSRKPPGIARFELLLECFEQIERAVQDIDRAPWLSLEREVVSMPTGRCGVVTSLELSRSAASAQGLTAQELDRLPAPTRYIADKMGGRLPKTIRRTVGRHNNRRREHSDILAALHMWQDFLRGVLQGLEQLTLQEQLAPRLMAMQKQSRAMLRRLERLTRLPVFDGVHRSFGRPSPSHVYRKVPAYRRFFHFFQAFLAGLGDVRGDFVEVPLHRTFDLYETWCFLRLVHAAALEQGEQGAWRQAVEEQLEAGGLRIRLKTRPFSFGSFTLIFQRTYSEVWRPDGPKFGSFSRPMIPDIAIERIDNGRQGTVIVLDAKYRVENGLNDAIASIHMYRDALVHVGDDRDTTRRIVEGAFILTPHIPGEPLANGWHNDTPPTVFMREGYHEKFKFGAVSLRPGVTIPGVQSLLRKLLDLTISPSDRE